MTRVVCPTCHGNGYIYVPNPNDGGETKVAVDCPTCDAQGDVEE